jgi:uncharacterized protein (TIGR02453 family)
MRLKNIFEFLETLKQNNNRTWFKANEKQYQTTKKEFEQFVEVLIMALKGIDSTVDIINPKDCIFRIFRDVRFSKNKDPYKVNFGAFVAPGGRKSSHAGYYVHLEPGSSFVGGGIYMPQPPVLKAIRNEIFNNAAEFKTILNDENFKAYFSSIYGEKLKMAPKGFPKDFEDIDLLKHKHFAVTHDVSDDFWYHDRLVENISKIFKAQLTFNQFLNRAVNEI